MLKYFNNTLCLILAGFLVYGCTSRKNNEEFTLSGYIKSKTSNQKDRIILSYVDALQNEVNDTVFTTDNEFKFKGNIKGATMCVLSLGKLSYDWDAANSVQFFLEPHDINVTIDKDNIQKAEVTGSKTQLEFKKLESQTKPIMASLDPLISRRNNLVKIKKEKKSSSIIEEIDSINVVQKIKLQKKKDITLSFIENNHQSYLSAFWLYFYINELPIDYIKLNYNKFSDSVKTGFYALKILEHLKRIESTVILKIGDKLPDFRLKDMNGNYISLDSFKKRKFLIVFWASWCGPCREEIPFLKKLYKKYYSPEFDMISISLDKTEADWLKAVKVDTPQWLQLLDSKGFESDLINQLNIKVIPDYILIGNEGEIVDKGLDQEELEGRLDKWVLSN